ncbi:hypothetical protein K502DRAFT_364507 [Neoconidiobolus thromboides FSU 785]|nr:hypothetical protein K502DRAFT_364507 [Neoconidiobolus thromboides FSU 785]
MKENKIKLNKRGYRCDQCSNSHVKCDRLVPKCSRCIRRHTECTFKRKVVYFKKENTEYQLKKYLPEFKLRSNVSINFAHLGESRLNSKSFRSKGAKYQLSKLPEHFEFSYSILGIFNKFQRKILLENLLNFIQNPSPFFPSKGLDLFIILTHKLGLLASKRRKLNFIPKVPKSTSFNIGLILNQAIIKYFEFVNTVFPLFDKTRFSFNSYSFILKSAILIGGLLYMEQTEDIKILIKYFEGKLYNFVSSVPKIKPCLENIQTILILIVGTPFFPWIASLKECLLFHCYRISFVIGLNHSTNKLPMSINIERAYTYCILNAYYNGTLLAAGSYVAEPMLLLKLKRLNSYFAHKITSYHLNLEKYKKIIQQYCFLKLQEFYYIISTIFFDLRLIKERKVEEAKDQIKFSCILKKLSLKIFRVKERYTTIMNNFLPAINDQDLKLTVEDYQGCIIYFYHHINYYIYYTRFSVSKEKSIYEFKEYSNDRALDRNTIDYTGTIFKECHLVIDSAIRASHKYTLALDYILISICLVFMIRYGRDDDKNDIYIQKGRKMLKSLLKTPYSSILCRMNLNLIEIITKASENTPKALKK